MTVPAAKTFDPDNPKTKVDSVKIKELLIVCVFVIVYVYTSMYIYIYIFRERDILFMYVSYVLLCRRVRQA